MLSISQAPVLAIIGGGCSGTLTAVQLLRQSSNPLRIVLIERQPAIGKGIAYSTQNLQHLLNVPALGMSALPNDPTHFLRWLKQHSAWQPEAGITSETFAPRRIYGLYLQTVLHNAQTQAAPGVVLEWLTDEAIELRCATQGVLISLRCGGALWARRVVLALGNFPPGQPQLKDNSFYRSRRYIADPWQAKVLTRIRPHDRVAMIGSGLTMIDMAISLQTQGHQGQIRVVSRHGLLPQSHQPGIQEDIPPMVNPLPTSLRALVRQVREQIAEAARLGISWQTVIDSLRAETPQLWARLSASDKERFLRHVRPYWEIHRHRTAPELTTRIHDLQQHGQLSVQAGRIHTYRESAQGVHIIFQKRHTQDWESFEVDWVINCTGPQSNYHRIGHPLLENLRTQALLCPDALALGLDTEENGALRDIYGKVSPLLYTLGPARKATRWESTAVPEIRVQAQDLAAELVTALKVVVV